MPDNEVTVIILNPVNDFIYSFDEIAFAKILREIELLEKFGIGLKMPHSKKINKNLYELRIRGGREARILYAFIQGKVFLLHGFVKKSDKISIKEIELAFVRLKELTNQ